MLIKNIVGFFKSLKLTATLLAFSIVLVFVGTIAQADEGLYVAQAHYFRQWIVVGAYFFGQLPAHFMDVTIDQFHCILHSQITASG